MIEPDEVRWVLLASDGGAQGGGGASVWSTPGLAKAFAARELGFRRTRWRVDPRRPDHEYQEHRDGTYVVLFPTAVDALRS